MSTLQHNVDTPVLLSNTPIFDKEAAKIAAFLSSIPVPVLAERLSLSLTLASKASMLFYDFPNKTIGIKAINAFTGEVFKSLDISSLDVDTMKFLSEKIGIISSLYGYLHPDNIIKPYRLDFNSKGLPEDISMAKYWKKNLTIYLVKYLKEKGEKEILDLLPSEASKCIDWKVVKAFAKVLKVNFKTFDENGELKTPPASRLKELRGLLTRQILLERINNFQTLLCIEANEFCHSDELSKSGIAVFIS